MEITSPPSRRLRLIVGEFSRSPQRPRVISAAGAALGEGVYVCVCVGRGGVSSPPLLFWSGVFSETRRAAYCFKSNNNKKPLSACWQLPGTADGTFPGSFGFVFMDPSGREPINSVGRLKA